YRGARECSGSGGASRCTDHTGDRPVLSNSVLNTVPRVAYRANASFGCLEPGHLPPNTASHSSHVPVVGQRPPTPRTASTSPRAPSSKSTEKQTRTAPVPHTLASRWVCWTVMPSSVYPDRHRETIGSPRSVSVLNGSRPTLAG